MTHMTALDLRVGRLAYAWSAGSAPGFERSGVLSKRLIKATVRVWLLRQLHTILEFKQDPSIECGTKS